MTDEERREAERLAWQHLDIADHEDRNWQSYVDGYAAACEVKREAMVGLIARSVESIQSEHDNVQKFASDFQTRYEAERARCEKLIKVLRAIDEWTDDWSIKGTIAQAIAEDGASRD